MRTFEPIAIVGRSCVLPGALSPTALTQAVAAGQDLVSSTPQNRWGVDHNRTVAPFGEGQRTADFQDRAWSDRGGYVRGFDELFDPTGFALPEETVTGLDPLFQWVLHTGRQAWRDAGLESMPRAAVVLGNLSFPSAATNRWAEDHWLRQAGLKRPGASEVPPHNRFMSGLPAHLLARSLGLEGGSFALDSACASSLYALALACQKLHDRRADAVLAGAVSCADDLFIHVGFCALDALSKSGRSRPFHRGADGLLPAEGAAFVVLQRLSDAVASGRPILGVIRGVGLSNDGRGRGLLTPSEEGQHRALVAAYAAAGLAPKDISLVECHATGTPVGDATEIRSLGRLYAGLGGVPIGSLKSNLGHLVTAAGMAGLLKILGAMERGERPPTLHVDDPNPALEGSPFRLLQQAEPWQVEGPRRAALSAFGFGGNNAHLLVEEWRPQDPARVAIPETPPPAPKAPVAVVSLSVLAGGGQGLDDFDRHLFTDDAPNPTASAFDLPLVGLSSPPADLKQTLPQQLLLLRAARQAVDPVLDHLERSRTGVWIGMGCDAEIARYGLRWRLTDWAKAWGVDPAWTAEAREAAVAGLQAAGVLGTMPNMPANRLNRQFDFGGPSASVSAEELSGLRALELARRAVSLGELDAAVVGAVDLSVEPVHEEAARALLPETRHQSGDAAVVLVLLRLDEARKRGLEVLGVLAEGQAPEGEATPRFALEADGEATSLTPHFGHAHAASGLLHAAAALRALHLRRETVNEGPGRPWLAPGRAVVEANGLGGESTTVALASGDSPGGLAGGPRTPKLELYSGADRATVLQALEAGSPIDSASGAGPARCVLMVPPGSDATDLRRAAAAWLRGEGKKPKGVHFREQPIEGQRAFIFTGAAAAYSGMGRDLLLALPQLGDSLRERFGDLRPLAEWVYREPAHQPQLLEQLWGCSFLCQAHAELSRGLLGMEPDAVLGISSGESNSHMAFGVWQDLPDLFRDTREGELFHNELAGDFRAVSRAWGGDPVNWESWVLRADVDDVKKALENEPRVHITLIHTHREVVIGGDAEGCRRVREALGGAAHPLGYPMAVHCPELGEVAEEWLELHRRKSGPTPAPRFYTHADGGHAYHPDRESSAQAILGQALDTVDFPAVLRKAWDDGVRIFLEHGPRGLCSRWIHENLRAQGVDSESYLAVPLDRAGRSLDAAADAIAQLLVAGVDLDFQNFTSPEAAEPIRFDGPQLTFESHWPRVELPPPPVAAPKLSQSSAEPRTEAVSSNPPQILPPAPTLPRVIDDPTLSASFRQAPPVVAQPAPAPTAVQPAPVPLTAQSVPAAARPAPVAPTPPPAATPRVPTTPPVAITNPAPAPVSGDAPPVLAGLADLHGRLAAAQRQFLDTQNDVHRRFLELQSRQLDFLAGSLNQPLAAASLPTTSVAPQPVAPQPTTPVAPQLTADGGIAQEPTPVAPPLPAPVAPALKPKPTPRAEASNGHSSPKPKASAPKPTPPPKPPEPAMEVVPPPPPVDQLPGPKYDRRQLEILAAGKISEVFGPLFEGQDHYPRQVRMPEPPFLLADRVTGIDAEPRSMGTGTIWTETDVKADSWYLHHGRMPGGLMIEAGQADLLLISWLGVDFLNKSERIYRLLGCELTYRGDLPQPGETLRYEIHIDAHANQGDVRLFFFHYDCHVGDEPRLQVRHGQAGFFTDEELANSGGLLWDAATAEVPPAGRLDPPAVLSERQRFENEHMVAFSEGRVYDCFGPGFELAASHTLTPRIQSGRMMLLHEVAELDPQGGPWGRGYLRAETPIRSEDWLFEGHFKNDPCMPGTVMFEGCLQAMAFYLTAFGHTLERDGWRFHPVRDIAYRMRCRGQVIPSSEQLTYEVFVREVHDGPVPTLYADLLCTVDGLKAFHAEGVGLELVPDWPLQVDSSMLEQPFPGGERPTGRPIATVPQSDGSQFAFDYSSLLACAWGRPSTAFGEMYQPFDGPRTVARLPGPPYHFMSRIAHIDGEMGRFQPGAVIETEYDIAPGAWYFDANGYPTMPYAVLLEAGLQPCGWLASFVGSALTDDRDLQFRNLDGTGTLHREFLPDSGTLKNRVHLTATSSSGGVIIVRFRVEMFLGEDLAYEMDTAFGFFPKAAMANQVGLPPSDEERERYGTQEQTLVDLTARPIPYFDGPGPRLADPRLLMIDRITAYDPEGGPAGLGYVRAVKDVNPSEWFFKAHFYQDPVQPGSLGIEALIQLLQFAMLHRNLLEELGADIPNPRFESISTRHPMTWKYRGQVLPTNELIGSELVIKEVGIDDDGAVYALADAWLWVDDKRIYSAVDLGMRIVPGDPLEDRTPAPVLPGEEVLDPKRDSWVADHCPTWTVPALPMMSMVDRLAAAANARHPELVVAGLEDVRVLRWISFADGPVRLTTEIAGEAERGDGLALEVHLLVFRQAPREELSRFETAATGTVLLAPSHPEAPAPLAPLGDDEGTHQDDPYAAGVLFHGPAFQLLRWLRLGASGSSAVLDAGAGDVPRGALHQALLDAATHGIPHDGLHRWSNEIPEGVAAYPRALPTATFYAPAPTTGTVRCEARFLGGADAPRTHLQLIAEDAVFAELELEEVLLPKGPIGTADPVQRRAFLTEGDPAGGLGLSRFDGSTSRLTHTELATSDWLPGTVGRIYDLDTSDRAELTRLVAQKDHGARSAGVHPATIALKGDEAVPARYPLSHFPLVTEEQGQEVSVQDGGPERLDTDALRTYWREYFQTGPWPGEDLYYSLIQRFVRRVVVEDPQALSALYGRPVLFLANHQVMLESLLFSTIASGLTGLPVITLAKTEHKVSWLGRFILHCFSYPGLQDPELIAFFDRENLRSLPLIIRDMGKKMAAGERSVMVHCEGTRSLDCRTPVKNLSGSFVDLALKRGAAIVPVRFVGGLPAEPLEARIDFPLGCGRQDYWLGKPLLPSDLEPLRYRERREAVIAAINDLGPHHTEEEPLPGDPELESAVVARATRTGSQASFAVVYEVLRRIKEETTPEIARLLAADGDEVLRLEDTPKGRWLAETARWIYGEGGTRVEVG